MFRHAISILLVTLIAALPASGAEVALTLGQGVSWEIGDTGTTYTYDGLAMSIRGDEPEVEGDWIESVTLSVKSTKFGKLSVTSIAGLTGFSSLGVYEVDSEGGLTILFDSYTGGAHCCTQTNSIYLGGSEPIITDVGAFNGGYRVEDVDGDSISEIIVSDDRFLYAFEAYAFSFPPVMILKSRGGEVYDATTDPSFRHAIREDYDDIEPYCLTDEGINPSACAGMLADAARLGTFAEDRREIAAAIAAGTPYASGWGVYTFCANEDCDEQDEFDDFLVAVDHALYQWGYLKN